MEPVKPGVIRAVPAHLALRPGGYSEALATANMTHFGGPKNEDYSVLDYSSAFRFEHLVCVPVFCCIGIRVQRMGL